MAACWLPGLRQVRRRRHGRRDAAPVGRDARDPDATRHDPLGYDIRTELFGSRDSISVGLGPRTPMRSVEPGVPPPAGPGLGGLHGSVRDAYARSCGVPARRARREESACTARDGLEAVRVAVAATRSLREHRPVRWRRWSDDRSTRRIQTQVNTRRRPHAKGRLLSASRRSRRARRHGQPGAASPDGAARHGAAAI